MLLAKKNMHEFKSANWKIAKMALLNPWMKFEKYFGQKHSFEALWKNIPNMSQDPPNPGFMQEKVQKGDFLKKSPHGNWKIIFESLEHLEG